MCDFCTAMTAGEAEAFYHRVQAGLVTAVPKHFGGPEAPRKGLRVRQVEELELGAFADEPEFRSALLSLCEMNTNGDIDFERMLVDLRERHGRPVWTTEQVRAEIAKAQARLHGTSLWPLEWEQDLRAHDAAEAAMVPA